MKAFTIWYAGMVVSDATYATSAKAALKQWKGSSTRGTVIATPVDCSQEENKRAQEASRVIA